VAVEAREPRGNLAAPRCERSRDAIAPYLSDAAHYPGGRAEAVWLPASEAEVAFVLRGADTVLPVGARSSLTGGATPIGGVVLSTECFRDVDVVSSQRVRVGAGVVLAELEDVLRRYDLYYPPVPTFDGATVAGTVATNAAGAGTFKYGTTRGWVEAITVVLASGEVIDLERGAHVASRACPHGSTDAAGCFEILTRSGSSLHVPVPGYRVPTVAKCSAGYFAAPGMDLIDLFIGAEGTLGVVTSVELRVLPCRPSRLTAFVPLADDAAAVSLVAALREASRRSWRNEGEGIDVAAVEYVDARCLSLLREDGADRACGFPIARDVGAAVLVQVELEAGTSRKQVFDQIASYTAAGPRDATAAATPPQRLCRLLSEHGVLERTVPVLPDEEERRQALFRLREAVPEAVNRRVGEAQRIIDPTISKSGGDVIVPFERFGQSLERYRAILEDKGLDHAIWGHISDGNVHPNVIPRSRDEMVLARQAQLEIGMAAIELGGSPMSEHGVGRNPIKQELLRRLYGPAGIAAMRRVKAALDPAGKLAPGVLFEAVEKDDGDEGNDGN